MYHAAALLRKCTGGRVAALPHKGNARRRGSQPSQHELKRDVALVRAAAPCSGGHDNALLVPLSVAAICPQESR